MSTNNARRETMATYFAEHGLQPAPCVSFEDFLKDDSGFQLGIAQGANQIE